MSTHANAEILLAWLRERTDATVGDIAAAGLLNSRAASDAVQYAVRSGALERFVRPGARAKERYRYRVTGIALAAPRIATEPSFDFDCLLEAWGVTLKPLELASTDSRRHALSDTAQEG